MKNTILGFILIQLILTTSVMGQDGKQLFKTNCASCHMIGKGTLVGPDLGNVALRRSEEWLYKFILASQSFIKSGDKDAVAIYKEFNEIIMPDPAIDNDQLAKILAYIALESPAPVAEEEGKDETKTVAVETQGKPLSEATAEDLMFGEKLFAGHIRFGNEGAACNSCHHVTYDGIMAGGNLAKDLTKAFTRLSENGLKAIISNSPFPLMQQAYKHHELSEDEVYALTAFLQLVDKEAIYQQPRNYTQRFIYTGIGGVLVLLFVFSTIWFRRKKGPVNKKVFDRQISSSKTSS